MADKETPCPACGITLRNDMRNQLGPADIYAWTVKCKDRWSQPSQCKHLRAAAGAPRL